ncbi:hypothetical protein K7432_008689 [Basidiobolus ranarum]|uniref:Uncharacterized protein n=1 Tax=Basidiobolus ranarum TaxID=34480 RepID=A0ABR2WRN8_9FUNG
MDRLSSEYTARVNHPKSVLTIKYGCLCTYNQVFKGLVSDIGPLNFGEFWVHVHGWVWDFFPINNLSQGISYVIGHPRGRSKGHGVSIGGRLKTERKFGNFIVSLTR